MSTNNPEPFPIKQSGEYVYPSGNVEKYSTPQDAIDGLLAHLKRIKAGEFVESADDTENSPNEENSPPQSASESITFHICPICEKNVKVVSAQQTNLAKQYNLSCGHFAQVAFGTTKQFDTNTGPKTSNPPLATPRTENPPASSQIVPDEKWNLLREYQREGIRFFADSGFRALLGDDMGLGKTVQAICSLRYFPKETLPVLVICPASVTINWQREFKFWFMDKYNGMEYVPFIHRESIGGLLKGQQVYIVPNSILGKPKLLKEICEYGFKTIIVDESHQFKNENSKRTKALFALAENMQNVLFMSGTSVLNRVMEYWNTLRILRPRKWFHKRQLANMCNTDSKGKPLALSNYYRDQFFRETESYILRRTKAEVLKDLPAKNVTKEWISFSSNDKLVKAYNAKLGPITEILAEIERNGFNASTSASLFGAIAELRHMIGMAKAVRATEYAASLVSSTGEKVCIGVHHRISIDLLESSLHYKRCPNCKNFVFECQDSPDNDSQKLQVCPTCETSLAHLDARKPLVVNDQSPEIKQGRIDQFREDPDQALMILSILGGGVGLNLQFCPNVLVIEREWNRALEAQFEDRFHRFGMKNPVTITYLLAVDTIDEFFDELVSLKGGISESTLSEDVSVDEQAMYKLAQIVVQKRMKFVGA